MVDLSNTLKMEDIQFQLAEKKLYEYVVQGWHVIDPEPLIETWSMEAVCEHLQAVSKGQIRNLVINIPPRHSKSLMACVFWPSWEWGPFHKPEIRWIFATHRQELTLRDSVRCRRLIQSHWYQSRWGNVFQLTGDQNQKHRFENNHGGVRLAIPVGGALGEGGDRVTADDIHPIKEQESDSERETKVNWYKQEFYSRVNNPRTAGRVIIMQRLHEKDISGEMLKRKDWEHLCLPMEYEPQFAKTTVIGYKDKRTEENQLLSPERFSREEIEEWKLTLGYSAPGQLQQRPTPIEGAIIKSTWWNFYSEIPKLKEMDLVFQSWDLAFKDLKSSSYVVGLVWGCKGSQRFLLARRREQLSFTNTIKAILQLTEEWPSATLKLIEDKANGPAVIDSLKGKISGIIPISPEGSKESRAFSISPEVEAGDVFLPSPELHPWVHEYIRLMSQFPKGPSDDMDATTQALIEARRRLKVLKLSDIAPIGGLMKRSVFTGMSRS